MIGKITAAVVAAILLSSAGVASAQNGRTGPTYSRYHHTPYRNSYYNGTYWRGIRNVAPYSSNNEYDPLRGTYFDDVAPY
ncbi:MAG: hypothetical protein WA858_09275 [Xanthobacteraceae bacterium]|jgi:hypothetical protein